MNTKGHMLFKSDQIVSYSDDVAIIARYNRELEKLTRKLVKEVINVGLQIN